MLLSKRELESASLWTVTQVAARHHFGPDYGPWTNEDIKAYMRKERRKTAGGLVGDTLGEETSLILGGCVAALAACMSILLYASMPTGKVVAGYIALVAFCAMTALGWRCVWHFLRGTSWQTQVLHPEDGMYYRDNVRQRAPAQIRSLAGTLMGLTSKDAILRISFIGEDPILWIYHKREEVAAAVWDELPDGTIKLLPPPRR